MTAYTQLVADGGRPVYPISQLNEVFRCPEAHLDLLGPWSEDCIPIRKPWRSLYNGQSHHESFSDLWAAFQRQWFRWQDFRVWQRDNRDIQDDITFEAYAVEYKAMQIRGHEGDERILQSIFAEFEADPSIVERAWERRQFHRGLQSRRCRETHSGAPFADYIEATKRRLSRHGYNFPYELMQDPAQQDTWSTWVEYLCCECWWLDHYLTFVDDMKPIHDKGWQELVDANVLQPGDTQDYVITDSSHYKRHADENSAKEVVRRAQTDLDQALIRPGVSEAERERISTAATDQLQVAKDQLASASKRFRLIYKWGSKTVDFRRAQRAAAHHRILLSWITDQLAIIKADTARQKSTQPHVTSSLVGKRKLDSSENNYGSDARKPKRPRCEPPHSPLPFFSRRRRKYTNAQHQAMIETRRISSRRNHEIQGQPTGQDPPSPLHSFSAQAIAATPSHALGGPRRSARIAARQTKTATAAVALATSSSRRTRQSELSKPTNRVQEPRKSVSLSKIRSGAKQRTRTTPVPVLGPQGVTKRTSVPRKGRHSRKISKDSDIFGDMHNH